MKREQLPLYALALAVLIVGLVFAGVPVGTLVVLPFVLACPLMMFFMMRGMDHGGSPRTHDDERDSGPARAIGARTRMAPAAGSRRDLPTVFAGWGVSAGHPVPAAGSLMHAGVVVGGESHGLGAGGHVLAEVGGSWIRHRRARRTDHQADRERQCQQGGEPHVQPPRDSEFADGLAAPGSARRPALGRVVGPVGSRERAGRSDRRRGSDVHVRNPSATNDPSLR